MQSKQVLIIHCAGNDGVNIDSFYNYHYPVALYDNGKKATNFITVGWSRPLFDYRLAHPNSCYGKTNVDLFAPGSDIFTTAPHNQYDFRAGSSMSTPCVTGVAALLLSYFPSLSTKQVTDIILKSTFDPNQMVNRPGTKIQVPFKNLSSSGGILNAYNAIEMAIDLEKIIPNDKHTLPTSLLAIRGLGPKHKGLKQEQRKNSVYTSESRIKKS